MRWLALLLLLIATPANATIAFVNAWTGVAATTPVTVNTSTGTQMAAGDVCVASVTWYDPAVATSMTIAGWTTAVGPFVDFNFFQTQQVFYKVAAAGDVGATFTVNVSPSNGSYFANAGIACFRSAQSPPSVIGAGNGGAGTVPTGLSVTLPSSGNALIWTAGGSQQAVVLPVGYSSAFNVPWSSGVNQGNGMGYVLNQASGATGNVASASVMGSWTAVMLALAPAPSITQYVNPTIRLGHPHPVRTWRH